MRAGTTSDTTEGIRFAANALTNSSTTTSPFSQIQTTLMMIRPLTLSFLLATSIGTHAEQSLRGALREEHASLSSKLSPPRKLLMMGDVKSKTIEAAGEDDGTIVLTLSSDSNTTTGQVEPTTTVPATTVLSATTTGVAETSSAGETTNAATSTTTTDAPETTSAGSSPIPVGSCSCNTLCAACKKFGSVMPDCKVTCGFVGLPDCQEKCDFFVQTGTVPDGTYPPTPTTEVSNPCRCIALCKSCKEENSISEPCDTVCEIAQDAQCTEKCNDALNLDAFSP